MGRQHCRGILSKVGYDVLAVTGKPEAADFLQKMGASEVIGREEVDDQSGKALLKPLFCRCSGYSRGTSWLPCSRACTTVEWLPAVAWCSRRSLNDRLPFIPQGGEPYRDRFGAVQPASSAPDLEQTGRRMEIVPARGTRSGMYTGRTARKGRPHSER